MVIWLSICLSLFLLCPLMTVVVHSFVADSSLLDCCDLVFFFFCVCVCVFLHLMLAGRQPFGILRWFQLFVSFIWCQLFACLIRAANFRLLPAIVLLVLSLPQAFVVCSFFLCHRHLCTVSFFHGLFCRRNSCWAFCLCLVSACFRVSALKQIPLNFGIPP